MVPEIRQTSLKDSASEVRNEKIDIVITINSFIKDVNITLDFSEKQLAKLTRKFIKTLEKDEYASTWIHNMRSETRPNLL